MIRRISSKVLQKKYMPALFAVVFAGIGASLLLFTRAAVPAVTIEAENGTRVGSAIEVADTLASGGKAIQFQASASPTPTPTPTVTPGQCAAGGAYLWSNLETCGWPGPNNTGPDIAACGGALTAYTGNANITTNNTTISCKTITKCLSIQATNVTITNVTVTCATGRTAEDVNGTGAIKVEAGGSAVISNAKINGTSSVHACIWTDGLSVSITKVDCVGMNDGIFNWNTSTNNLLIKDSYFHDFTAATANGHIDGYQTEGTKPYSQPAIIEHNTFRMNIIAGDPNRAGGGIDSAIAIWNGYTSSDNITVRNNLITGGGFAIYAQDYHPSESSPAGGNVVTNIRFENNVFSTYQEGNCVGFYGIWFYRSSWTYKGGPTGDWGANGNVRTGNKIIETGQSLDTGNPAGCT